ncbi:hypothetical protein C8R45DRAFT_1082878 [Mycena sanguinolenta]|nr:hypothetical protein C8R45DRAFT_1082878 [Mycena sanguinolenta]
MLPSLDAPHAEVDSLCAVLDHLPSISKCVLVGDAVQADRCQWHNLPSQLSAAILKFIQRPQLSQLHIFSIASLPGDVLVMCLTARTLAFVETSVDNMTAANLVAPFHPAVEDLAISCSPDIVDILTSSQCSHHVAKIRKLWVDDRVGMKLLSTLGANLQHIHIDSDASAVNLGDFLPLPTQLPCLRSIEITLRFTRRNDPSFVPILASVAGAASATLQEICVTYAQRHGLQSSSSLVPQTMAGVEDAIVGCTGSPPIRWRHEPPTSETFFGAFSASVAEGMPRLHKEGRLVVEISLPTMEARLAGWNGSHVDIIFPSPQNCLCCKPPDPFPVLNNDSLHPPRDNSGEEPGTI